MNSNVISKTFSVLRAFTDVQNEWGVNELSRYLQMPVSSIHRMISILKEEHVLEYSQVTSKYKIGSEFIRISSIISTNVDVKQVARPYLEHLAAELKHSVYFALYYPQHQKLSFIDRIKSAQALQYILDIGFLEPIHIAASGKSILAHLSEKEIDEILKIEIDSEKKREEFKEELKTIKDQGYAKTANERKKGAQSIGAPIFNASNKVIGSIICVFPIGDYVIEKESFYIDRVKVAAEKISYSLGSLKGS